MPKWLMALLTAIIGVLLRRVSPIVKKALRDLILDLEKKAKSTPNTIDDLLVDFLKEIFDDLFEEK